MDIQLLLLQTLNPLYRYNRFAQQLEKRKLNPLKTRRLRQFSN
jgi:hypothetical protein